MITKCCAIALILTITVNDGSAQGLGQGAGRGRGQGPRCQQPISQVIASIPESKLSEQEREGLLWMREEEKLAHDVYVKLSKKWQLRPLVNISSAEAMHQEALKKLLDRYEIEDPLQDKAAGVFTNPEMQDLYDKLVKQGEQSIGEAIKVGLLIEELDIVDLIQRMEQADNHDVKVVYQNLLKGSRNHLRVFSRQLRRYNETYTPQHLSQKEFDHIAQSEHERGKLITDPDYQF